MSSGKNKIGKKERKLNGPILGLDLGQRRVGLAVSDKLLLSIRRLDSLQRSSWKQLLRDVVALVQRFDAKTLVIGLPLRLNGSTGSAAVEVERIARKFAVSLEIPVVLQDERLTSVDARERLSLEGHSIDEIPALIDSESAVVIVRDLITNQEHGIIPKAVPISS
jgi:putative holliday junction resolvase